MSKQFTDKEIEFFGNIAKRNNMEMVVSKRKTQLHFMMGNIMYTIPKSLGDVECLIRLRYMIATHVNPKTNMQQFGLSDIMIEEKITKITNKFAQANKEKEN